MISYEKLNMSNRKYWWLWLDVSIIIISAKDHSFWVHLTIKYILILWKAITKSSTHQIFDRHWFRLCKKVRFLIKYRYYGAYNSYQDQLEEAKIKIESLELDFKKSYKEI